MEYYDRASEILKENGYRMTQIRHQILSLFEQSEKVLLLGDLENDAAERKIDTVTVYRTLHIFEDLGIIIKIHSVGGYVKAPDFGANRQRWQYLIDQKTLSFKVISAVDTGDTGVYPWPGFSPQLSINEILGDFSDSEEQSISPTSTSKEGRNNLTQDKAQEKISQSDGVIDSGSSSISPDHLKETSKEFPEAQVEESTSPETQVVNDEMNDKKKVTQGDNPSPIQEDLHNKLRNF